MLDWSETKRADAVNSNLLVPAESSESQNVKLQLLVKQMTRRTGDSCSVRPNAKRYNSAGAFFCENLAKRAFLLTISLMGKKFSGLGEATRIFLVNILKMCLGYKCCRCSAETKFSKPVVMYLVITSSTKQEMLFSRTCS